MTFQIRRAGEADAEGVACVLRSIPWLQRFQGEPIERTTERVREQLRACTRDDSHSVYVAEAGGRVIGYAIVHWLQYFVIAGLEGFVSDVFVADDARGRGVGTALLDALRDEGLERGACRLSLLNSRTRDSYERGFYSKNGWEERDSMANFVLYLPGDDP